MPLPNYGGSGGGQMQRGMNPNQFIPPNPQVMGIGASASPGAMGAGPGYVLA